MGLVFLASRLQLLPPELANLWPVLLIVIGLGGLLTSDREEWLSSEQKVRRAPAKTTSKSAARSARTTKKTTRKTTRKKK